MTRRTPRPDDPDKPFIVRWNTLARILLVDTSVKYVARAAMDFADYETGASCFPSNERIARETGYSEPTIRNAWKVMRGLGMAERVAFGVAHRRLADEYQLLIPGDWELLPTLGPHGRKFTCVGCGKLFNPQGGCEVRRDGSVGFKLAGMCFCPPPRAVKGRGEVSCLDAWSAQQVGAGGRSWTELGGDQWKAFRHARGDDW